MVNAIVWINQNYPVSGTCQRIEDKENYGKARGQITSLDISGQNLEGKLDGGEGWTNLRKYNISFNKLTSGGIGSSYIVEEMDFSSNQFGIGGYVWGVLPFPLLRKLNLSNNLVEKLDLSKLPRLTHFDISNNLVTKLDLRGSRNLQELNCSDNPLTDLSLSSLSSPHLVNCPIVVTPSSSSFSIPLSTSDPLSNSDKIALGTGVGLGIPGLFLTTFGSWIAWKEYKKKKRARTMRTETERNELGEGTSRTIVEGRTNDEITRKESRAVSNQVERQKFQTQIEQSPK